MDVDGVTWGDLADIKIQTWWKELLQRHPVLTAPVGVKPLVRAEARIDLKDDRPIAVPPHRLALTEAKFAKDEVTRLKKLGIVYEVKSPYSAPVVVVKKKDGSLRLCVDYRKLNLCVIKDKYPLPRVEDLLVRAARAKVFSKVDMKMGFHQIPIKESHQKYLAFTVGSELLTYRSLPFGLVTSPAEFCRVVNDVLRPLGDRVVAYVDDILILSDSVLQHVGDVEAVVKALAEACFRIALKKCVLFSSKIQFLGHMVSHGEISQDPARTKAILEQPNPVTPKALRSVLGSFNYYRPFIKDFATLAAPLYQALQRRPGDAFPLKAKELQVLTSLRQKLTTTPALSAFSSDLKTRVEVDASKFGVGAVLAQPRHAKLWGPVAFMSKAYTPREQAFGARDLELYGMYLAILHWRVYLSGRPFEVLSDHQGLTLLQGAKFSNRIRRWVMGLSDFDFVVKYRSGRTNVVADLLSRAFPANEDFATDAVTVTTFDVESQEVRALQEDDDPDADEGNPDDYKDAEESAKVDERGLDHKHIGHRDAAVNPDWDLPSRDEFLRATRTCPSLKPVLDVLEGTLHSVFRLRVSAKRVVESQKLMLKEGLIVTGKGQIVPPEDFRLRIIMLYHVSPFAAHVARDATAASISTSFWWPNLNYDVEAYVKSCVPCNTHKKSPRLLRSTLQIRQLVPVPFGHVIMDHIGPFARSQRGKRHILVVIDAFTSWVEAYPVRSTGAKETADTLWRELFTRFGIPLVLQSDNGTAFKNHLMERLTEVMGIKPAFSLPRQPHVNGQVERMNRTIKSLLASHEKNWEDALPSILLAIRRMPRRPLHLSSAQTLLGFQIRAPPEAALAWSDGDGSQTIEDIYVQERLRAYKITRLELEAQTMRDRERRAEDSAKFQNQRALQAGDHCLIFAPDRLLDDSHGVRTKWLGPVPVLKQVSAVTYLVLLNGHPRVFHIQRLLIFDPSGVPEGTPTAHNVMEQRRLYDEYMQITTLPSKELVGSDAKVGSDLPYIDVDGDSVRWPDDASELKDPSVAPATSALPTPSSSITPSVVTGSGGSLSITPPLDTGFPAASAPAISGLPITPIFDTGQATSAASSVPAASSASAASSTSAGSSVHAASSASAGSSAPAASSASAASSISAASSVSAASPTTASTYASSPAPGGLTGLPSPVEDKRTTPTKSQKSKRSKRSKSKSKPRKVEDVPAVIPKALDVPLEIKVGDGAHVARPRERYTSPAPERRKPRVIIQGQFYVIQHDGFPTLVKAIATDIGRMYEGTSRKCRPLFLDDKSRKVFVATSRTVPAVVDLSLDKIITGPFTLDRDRVPSDVAKLFQ